MEYTVVLQRDDDKGNVARVPALPGCISQSDNWDEAISNIREAAQLYLEDCQATGQQRQDLGTPF